MNKAVLLKRSGLDVRISMTCETYQAPKSGAQLGCSVYDSGATIHDTCGSFPRLTSSRKISKSRSGQSDLRLSIAKILVPVLAPSARAEPGNAFWYWWKYSK